MGSCVLGVEEAAARSPGPSLPPAGWSGRVPGPGFPPACCLAGAWPGWQLRHPEPRGSETLGVREAGPALPAQAASAAQDPRGPQSGARA